MAARGVAGGEPGETHHLTEEVQGTFHFTIGPYSDPVLHIRPGDRVVVDTMDAFGGAVQTEADLPSARLTMPYVNPQNGPIMVEGAEIGPEADLCAALEGLPPKLRQVVVLRDIYDLPHEAIAAERCGKGHRPSAPAVVAHQDVEQAGVRAEQVDEGDGGEERRRKIGKACGGLDQRLARHVGALEAVPGEHLLQLLRACGHLVEGRGGKDFPHLRALLAELNRTRPKERRLAELSMGMSGDFEVAVQEGATWLRIGTALFGERGKE